MQKLPCKERFCPHSRYNPTPVTTLRVNRDSDVPVSRQLAGSLQAMIDRRELRPGDRLPSLRDAATAAAVNVNTVRAAYAKLEDSGAVVTEQGRGTFVAPEPIGDEASLRRGLRDEIARLETQLVSLPMLTPHPKPGRGGSASGARLLSVEELTAVRDGLAERVSALFAARAAIVEQLAQGPSERERPAARVPSRRSSSSVAGAQIRWTGA